uniref:Nose resistant-to-fluoxetine protein N-terminal domain-containing protein n=1 Tax=Glossina morsitans morsitans TaxID=37546 RepID=A0A1B0FQH3_GLOMM
MFTIRLISYVSLLAFITPAYTQNLVNSDHHNDTEATLSDIVDFNRNSTVVLQSSSNEFSNLPQLRDALNIFDISYLAKQWFNIQKDVSLNCSKDIYKYLNALNNSSIWALKMDDASGHYTSGFFYGNNYWMGSMSLCKAIHHAVGHDRGKIAVRSAGLPFSKDNDGYSYPSIYNDNPPFMPGFFIIKIFFNETYPMKVTRTIYAGVCLPSTCNLVDVKQLFRKAQKQLDNRQVRVIDVRMPTNQKFNLYEDRTFWILAVDEKIEGIKLSKFIDFSIVSAIVFILILSGTMYEIYVSKRFKEVLRQQDKEMMNNSETSSGIGCASSDYGDTVTRESLKKESLKDLQIVLNLPKDRENCEVSNDNPNTSSDEYLEGHLHESDKLSVYSELLLSFSVITNFKAICDHNVGADTLASIHGLRAFSMFWVILGHTCIVVFKYSDNMEMRKDVERNFLFQAITNGPFSVDTFFFISGCLVSYLYFRTNAKGKLNKLAKGSSNEWTRCAAHFFGLIVYRFMRLTGPYMFVLGVVQVTMKYLAATSIFEPPTLDHLTCPHYWWRNMLYINTLFPVEQMCMLWSWYLANDTQFYIIGAIILIIGVRHFQLSAITTCAFLIVSWIVTAIVAFTNNHRPDTDDPLALFDKIYDKPWTRLGPYLIGMAVGWTLFRTNCKIRLPRMAVVTAWALTMVNLLVLVFGLYRAELSQFTAALYSSLSHSAWALSLAWITIACSTGYGGFVNTLLSAPCVYPFSRVTYCAYLVHPIVIRSMALNADAPMHLGGDTMVIMFFGFVVASYLLSFVVSMSFEAPVVTMLKILSPSRKKRLA